MKKSLAPTNAPEMTISRVWMVSISGDPGFRNTLRQVTVAVTLPFNQTPVDWMLSRPKVYYCEEFTPNFLAGFWPILNKAGVHAMLPADLRNGPIVLHLSKYTEARSQGLGDPDKDDLDEDDDDNTEDGPRKKKKAMPRKTRPGEEC